MADMPKTVVVYLDEPQLVEGITEPATRFEFFECGSVVDRDGNLHIHNATGTIASFASGVWRTKMSVRFRPGDAGTAHLAGPL